MQEVSQIKCENAAAFVQKIRVLWNGGQTNWSKNYSTSQSLTIDLTSCNIPDRTEVWIEVQAVLGKTKESPEHVLYSSKSPCEAIYRTTGATLSFKVELHGLILNESKAKQLRVEQLIEDQLKEDQLKERLDGEDRLKTNTSKKDELFISNAGLYLLRSWILMIFNDLGYMSTIFKFKDTESQIRAVFLMQYLTYLEEKTYYNEEELMLNRLIVGLPMDFQLPTHLELTHEEKIKAESLIVSFKTAFHKMDGFSIKGIQYLFIQRKGRLEQQEREWVLTIEKRSCDIMFDIPSLMVSQISLQLMEKDVQVVWLDRIG